MGKNKTKLKKNFGQFWLPVLLLLVLVGTTLFWSNISWIANGEVWRQIVSDAFPQYFPKPYVMAVKKTTVENTGAGAKTVPLESSQKNNGTTTEQRVTPVTERRDMITIPAINITAPIITAQTNNNDVIRGLLDSGVVLYPGSVPFGQVGQTVILGHSAPTGWPKIKYDWVFSKLGDLKKGDMVVITYNFETRYCGKNAGCRSTGGRTRSHGHGQFIDAGQLLAARQGFETDCRGSDNQRKINLLSRNFDK